MQLKMLIAALIIVSIQPIMWGMEQEPQAKEQQIIVNYEIKEPVHATQNSITCSLKELQNFKQIYVSSGFGIMLLASLKSGGNYIKYKIKMSEYSHSTEQWPAGDGKFAPVKKCSLIKYAHISITVPVRDPACFESTDIEKNKHIKLEFKAIEN